MIKNNEELQIQDVVTIRVSRCVENLILVLYISQLSNQIAERVDNIFRIIHVFVDNIVSIDTRLCFCFKSYVAASRRA